jgi:hypothetical protein
MLFLLLAVVPPLQAQVLSPYEMPDPAMRRLQQQYLDDLKFIGTTLTEQHSFPYPFYFSRKLDIDEAEQQQIDQRSIRFERYNNQVALAISGNYYASYSDQRLDLDHRVRQTYIDVLLPILQAAVPRLVAEPQVEVFAIEVSYHVRKKVMGVDTEYPENVVVVVPRDLAAKLIQTKDLAGQQQLMLDAEVYDDTAPVILWLVGDKPTIDESRARAMNDTKVPPRKPSRGRSEAARLDSSPVVEQRSVTVPFQLATRAVPEELRNAPLHNSTPSALKSLQEAHQGEIEKIVQDLDTTAHFVSYAPPAFIEFKQGAYLQLSMITALDADAAGSQYKLAALAFDRHVSHLLRPILLHLSDTDKFDGIDFSTTVKVAGDKTGTLSQAVEFVLPFSALRCYEKYDCTGQQLLNSGIVLINGERVGLDLQSAETSTGH